MSYFHSGLVSTPSLSVPGLSAELRPLCSRGGQGSLPGGVLTDRILAWEGARPRPGQEQGGQRPAQT